jgi:hypothetical protein
LTHSCPARATPKCWAALAKGALRRKIPALKQALAGTFKPHHTLIGSHLLAHLDYLDERDYPARRHPS